MLRTSEAGTLLVVDDDAVARDGLSEFLSDEGFVVHVAENGVDALVVFDRHRPSLVITDLEMPRMDGRALIVELRKRAEPPLILVITGRMAVDARREAEQLGVDAYVNKPVDLQLMLDHIRALF
jgi:DNA-binding response OmpR family regulator